MLRRIVKVIGNNVVLMNCSKVKEVEEDGEEEEEDGGDLCFFSLVVSWKEEVEDVEVLVDGDMVEVVEDEEEEWGLFGNLFLKLS